MRHANYPDETGVAWNPVPRLRRWRRPKSCCFARVGHSRRCFGLKMEQARREYAALKAKVGAFMALDAMTRRMRSQEAGR